MTVDRTPAIRARDIHRESERVRKRLPRENSERRCKRARKLFIAEGSRDSRLLPAARCNLKQ